MKTITFVTGGNGVGKSAVIPYLKETLDPNDFRIYDFDERGVPDNADQFWRIEETKHWISVGQTHLQENIGTIICGFCRPSELEEIEGGEDVQVILLDLNPSTLRKRLEQRNEDPKTRDDLKRATGLSLEQFIEHNLTFLPILRQQCVEHGCTVIKTDSLTPDMVALKIVDQL